jgi:8-oxo-dGTP pyrophosphatase MutT (NUDIX family)
VALILRPGPESPEALLIRRARHESDPWSGHMALPGGRRDPSDTSLLDTARRETREEVALQLERWGRMLGRLDPVTPRGAELPRLTILPFVFAIPREVRVQPSSREVAEVLWTPVGHLLSPESRDRHLHSVGGSRLVFPAFDVEGRTVWGLTHRILEDFLSRVPPEWGSK